MKDRHVTNKFDYDQVSNQEYAERKNSIARFRVNIKGADKYNLVDGQTDEVIEVFSTKYEAVKQMDARNKAESKQTN